MAKIKMMCPFSKKLCEECALYRGRHYYLCFCGKYRGNLSEPGEVTKVGLPPIPETSSNGKFEMPSIIPGGAIDPFVTNTEKRQKEV